MGLKLVLEQMIPQFILISRYKLRIRLMRLDCLFDDFSKAFDNVNHAFLLRHLYDVVVCGKYFSFYIDIYKTKRMCNSTKWLVYFPCIVAIRQGAPRLV